MNLKPYFFLLSLFGSIAISAQDAFVTKSLQTQRVLKAPRIDGVLDEEVWKTATVATDFIQQEPFPGNKASLKSEIKVIYTDDAIYVGAYLYDTAPDSILRQLTERDDEGNSDTFGFWLSPYNDGNNAFLFVLTSKGVQVDIKLSSDGMDYSWDAVWKSSAKIVTDGWVAEFEIPYSAIRFPKAEKQSWDINFMRNIRRYREQSFWNEIDPKSEEILQYSGKLEGIEDVNAPLRLFLYPYTSGYYNFYVDRANGEFSDGTSFNYGADLKYGINDAFTLDMTLIPDFGQVKSDAQILNTSAFEIRFDENRQFFTEGTELFNKGGIFYSRRIGGEAVNSYYLDDGEEYVTAQEDIQLINATKVSGRNINGLGVGVLNAVTQSSHVVVRDSTGVERTIETSPLTNYNIIVLDQNLKNNSYVSLTNTNVLREGSTYDANVVATEFNLKNKERSYAIDGSASYNKKMNYFDKETDEGFAYDISLEKIKGNFLFGVGTGTESEHYDPNDMGLLFSPNEVSYYTNMNYNIFKPFWKGRMNRMWSGLWTGVATLYRPRVFTNQWLGGNVGMGTKNFHSFGVEANFNFLDNYDYFEPRVDGRYYKGHANINYGFWFSTDYRKKIAIDISNFYNDEVQDHRKIRYYRIAPRIRFNDHLLLRYVYSYRKAYSEEGFTTIEDSGDIIFADRDNVTHTNVLTGKYVFNNKMALSLVFRHYWSSVNNNEFFLLDDLGDLVNTDYIGFNDDGSSDYNRSYNSFTTDIVYSWVFAPGSELSVVWKTNLDAHDNIIPTSLVDDFDYTFKQSRGNSISLKLLYFIDFMKFRKV